MTYKYEGKLLENINRPFRYWEVRRMRWLMPGSPRGLYALFFFFWKMLDALFREDALALRFACVRKVPSDHKWCRDRPARGLHAAVLARCKQSSVILIDSAVAIVDHLTYHLLSKKTLLMLETELVTAYLSSATSNVTKLLNWRGIDNFVQSELLNWRGIDNFVQSELNHVCSVETLKVPPLSRGNY
jgi:hypothetical protein